MEFRIRKARGALAEFVDVFWFYEGPPRPHRFERLLPDGATELVVNLLEDEVRVYDPRNRAKFERLTGGVVCGPHSNFFVIDTAQQQCVAGIHFHVGGAFAFLPLPAGELHGLHVALDNLWGGFARELRERLLHAVSVDERFDLLEAALFARLATAPVRHPAVRFALREFHGANRSVAAVREDTGMSTRGFIDAFRRQVGLPPKLYCRVRRFQLAIRQIRGTPIDWARLAAECGYSDQSHMIHEFRAIGGLTPAEYADQRTEHLNHVPILG